MRLGIGPVIRSILYKPIVNKDKSTIEKILKATQRFFNVIISIFLVYLIVLCFVYPTFVNSEFSRGYTVSLLIIISISTFAEYFLGMTYKIYLQAEQKTYVTSRIQMITTILNTLVSVFLIRLGANIQLVKLASAFIFVIRPLAQNIYVKQKYKINLKNVKEKYEIKQKWDGLAQHIASTVHNNTDMTVLTIFTNTLEISVYSVYYMVIRNIKNLIQAVNNGVEAAFGNMYAHNEQENLNKNFRIYELFYFTIATILFVCTLVLILPFVQVYTYGITDVNYYRPVFAYIIVSAEFIWAIRLPYSSLTLSVGHFKETRKGAWVEAITNIVISVILVIRFGLNGVAVGTCIAMLIRTIEFMYHSNKYILKRKQIVSFSHFIITIIETIIIVFIVNTIIAGIEFVSYIVWIKYAIVAVLVACIVVIPINCLVYRKSLKGLIEIAKKNFKKEDEKVIKQ